MKTDLLDIDQVAGEILIDANTDELKAIISRSHRLGREWIQK